jgi:hypothetical protein
MARFGEQYGAAVSLQPVLNKKVLAGGPSPYSLPSTRGRTTKVARVGVAPYSLPGTEC